MGRWHLRKKFEHKSKVKKEQDKISSILRGQK